MRETIRVAHSPDSDDAFMFYGLASGAVKAEWLEFVHELHDIETLNRAAVEGKYEITALSVHAYAYLQEINQRMHKAIKLDAISADVIDPRSGRPMPATIAFTLSYDGENAAVTQKVANELTTLYLNENLKSRTEKTAETYDFLTDETTKLSEHIAELETRLAEFKEKNVNTLPELAPLNYQLMDRTEIELRDTKNQLRSLDERKFYLEGQLAQMHPNSPMFSASGERILDPVSRLKFLKTELAAASAQYLAEHGTLMTRKCGGYCRRLTPARSAAP